MNNIRKMPALFALVAAAALAGSRFMQGARTLAMQGLAATPDNPLGVVQNRPNKARHRGNRIHQRAALKARNVRRFKAQSRG